MSCRENGTSKQLAGKMGAKDGEIQERCDLACVD